MDINEEKSAKSQLPIEEDHEQKATKSEETAKENDQVITTAPKTVTIESDANIAAEQVKEENPTEDKKNEEKAGEDTKESAEGLDAEKKPSEEKFKCRPIAFLLGLPSALISLVLAFVGGIIWILGLMLTCICPCCFCVTMLVEMALGLVNAPFAFFQYITDKIPF
ncbi:PREDICTED: uncharacterized protein LOC109212189 [Nicotiana attenuata]|uniref:Uncharacterized protein n=1 Tax=Nicotiana attenuata TaxID=49451 RepID=A0A314KI11_NICAT|nr:PREDICTED: uncharacterized protein LOC109212189 [Nicotiana attenuata]OIT28800.1 hypothetical protein A4A49_17215 [Nicotiana attenuata]